MIYQSVGNNKKKKKAPIDEDNRLHNTNEMRIENIEIVLKEQNQKETTHCESVEEKGMKIEEKERKGEEMLEKMARVQYENALIIGRLEQAEKQSKSARKR